MYLILDIGEQLRACKMYLTYMYLPYLTYLHTRERERPDLVFFFFKVSSFFSSRSWNSLVLVPIGTL